MTSCSEPCPTPTSMEASNEHTQPKANIFCDPIHGTIKLEGILLQIIDTPEFQRLRRIKQMGVNHYVNPGAVHTRFEHSVGVCYIAGEFIRKLLHDDVNKEIIEILKEHELNVKIAALCHDLGYGPFSHVYDSFLEENVQHAPEEKTVHHDYRSGEIVDKVIGRLNKEDSNINSDMIKQLIVFSEVGKEVMKECGAEDKEIESKILKKMKEKFLSKCKMTEKNMFLFEIVANGFSGIDVDKMDYFARDGHYIGLSKQFDWRRYIESTTVKEVPGGYHRLCSEDKVL
jgi:HD superfamily phosphohydrolase